MSPTPLGPLQFEPIFKKALWGGRRLGELLGRELPVEEPVGEAWVLSDQGDAVSRVADGPLRGRTLRELVEADAQALLGRAARRFPLLLKFIDARDALSLQVHPHDRHTHLLPAGGCGKTEAWVVLWADPGSCIYAGLRPGVGAEQVRRAVASGTLAECLHRFEPQAGDCVFLPAGVVHAIGAGVVLFEVQQTSDVTFRLYDWGRVDARTGQPRQLHVEQALACIDYAGGPVAPRRPAAAGPGRERLVFCEYFSLDRVHAVAPVEVGAAGSCRVLVGLHGRAEIEHGAGRFSLAAGEILLLPAAAGTGRCRPLGPVTFLECGLPS